MTGVEEVGAATLIAEAVAGAEATAGTYAVADAAALTAADLAGTAAATGSAAEVGTGAAAAGSLMTPEIAGATFGYGGFDAGSAGLLGSAAETGVASPALTSLPSTSMQGGTLSGYGPQGTGLLDSQFGNVAGQQFMTLPTSEFAMPNAAGGIGQGLEGTAAQAAAAAGEGGFSLSAGDAMKLAQLGYQGMKAGQQKPQQGGGARVVSGGDAGTPQRQGQSFAKMSPYSSFGGGFNPKKYGANVRKSGLLG